MGTTQIVTYGINASVLGRKLHTSVGISYALSRSNHGSYSVCYPRETGGEGRGRSLKTAYNSEVASRGERKCSGLHRG